MSALGEGSLERLRAILDAPDLETDRYRVLEPLGRGGMGTVYLAEDRLLGRPVAIKVLHVEDLDDETAARMMREARTLARLEHPGIVPIHDLGRLPDGRVFYAMKRVNGERLDSHVQDATPIPERLRLFLKVCETVAFAHAAGVLHRDLKPGNVMVGEFGEVLVLDWGVAKWTDTPGSAAPPGADLAPEGGGNAGAPARTSTAAAGLRDTSPGTVVGTPAYMAPEQARGETQGVDPRADVFGLGATLHHLLTGQPPGEGGPAPRPAALASICARACDAIPERRYSSVAHLAADVQRFLDGARVLAHRESPAERVGRVVVRYRVAIGLVAAYLAARGLIALFLRR